MRRLTLSFTATAIALAVSASAAAATQVPAQPAHVTGVILSGGGYSLTLQTPGQAVGVLNALTSAANRLQAANLPYVWGGGHAEAGVASVGEAGGNGYNGTRRGYDCSGSVAAVLASGGLWPAGASVPNDTGVISDLMRAGLIAPGAGTGAHEVTLYDEPGVHIFMNVDGRFFGTTDGGGGGNSRGGPGWLGVGSDVTSSSFKRYHILPSALDARTNAGYTVGFELGAGVGQLDYPAGTAVSVTYRTTASGILVAKAIRPRGEKITTGTVQAIAPDGSTVTLAAATGAETTFDVVPGSNLGQELTNGQVVVGDTVSAEYFGTPPATLRLIGVSVTATPPATTTTGTTTSPTTTGTATTPTATQTDPTLPSDPSNNGGSGGYNNGGSGGYNNGGSGGYNNGGSGGYNSGGSGQ